MAEKLKHKQPETASNIVQLPTKCNAQGCSKKVERLTFCSEHYDWFKFGLITKEGRRPTDFDKKHMAYQRQHKKAA